MTEADRADCERLARSFRQATGKPLVITATLAAQLRKAGFDMALIHEQAPIPIKPRLVYADAR